MDVNTSTTAADIFARALRGGETSAAADASTSSSASSNSSSSGDAIGSSSSSAIGGFLVCLDVPQATEFGVDYEVFRTGPKFQGVKFLPLGIHFVVFRSREQEHGIRQGFFMCVERHSQVIVREWSAEKEELGPPRPGLNVEHLEHAVLSFQLDSGLGAYPKQHHKIWTRMTKYISGSVLQRCGVELGALILPGDSDFLSDAAQKEAQASMTPFFPDLPRTVRFTPLLPKRKQNNASLSAVERTQYHFDRSELTMCLLDAQCNAGGAAEPRVRRSLARARGRVPARVRGVSAAVVARGAGAVEAAFLKLFRAHLEQIPEDFFVDEMTSENFLRPCLVSLFELLDDPEAPQQLRRHALQLKQVVQTRFGLDVSTLDAEEFAPVVVPEEELFATTSLQPQQQQMPRDDDDANAQIAAAFLASKRIM